MTAAPRRSEKQSRGHGLSAGVISRRAFLAAASALILQSGLALGSVVKSPSTLEELEDCLAPQRGEARSAPSKMPKPLGLDARSLFLTFDDGPLFCTGRILELLASRGHKATFFVIGRNLENPKLRKFAVEAVQQGHDIGNHSYNHPDFSTISAKRAAQEIARTHALIQEVIREAGGEPARQNRYFRFPYGVEGSRANSARTHRMLAQLNYHIAWWDVDTNDWRMEVPWFRRSPSRVLASLGTAKPLDVVLLHDRNTTAAHLPKMLEILDSHHLVSAPLSDLEFGSRARNEHSPASLPELLDILEKPAEDPLVEDLLRGLFPGHLQSR